MRAVLDTNVLVSSLLRVDTPPAAIRDAWVGGKFELVISQLLFEELEGVLERPKIRRNVRWSPGESHELLTAIRQNSQFVNPALPLNVITADPSDNRVLEAAVEGNARYIVSGDQHLLALGSFEGIEIVSPARFAAILAATSSS